MKLSIEFMHKVEELVKLEMQVNDLFSFLRNEMADYFDGCCIEGFHLTKEPFGELQNEDEYVAQSLDYCGDSGTGVYYYHVEGSEWFIAVSYSF